MGHGESVSKTSPTDVGEAASSRTRFRTGPYHGGGYEQGGASVPESFLSGAVSLRGATVVRR